MEVGIIKGLAQDLDYNNRIADLRYQKQQSDRATALNEAKAKLYADDLEFMNAANSYDNPRIKEFMKKQVGIIGKYASENPDWEGNVQKRTQMNLLKRDLKDNPELQRGMASDAAFKQLNADLAEVAKNPEQHDIGAYDNLMAQRDNYLKFGNQDGEDAARVHGTQAFVYRKPENFIDLGKKGVELGNRFKGNAMDIQYLKNGRDGAYQTVPKKELLDNAAKQYYAEHKRQFDVQYAQSGKDPIQAARELIQSGIESKFDIGQKNTFGEQAALAKYKHDLDNVPQGKSPYEITILKPGYAVANPTFLENTYGNKIPHTITNNDGSVQIDNTGDVFNYDGHVYDKGYRQDGKYQKTGIKTIDGYVYKPLDWAVEQGIVNDPFGPDLGRNQKVDGAWSKKAEIVNTPPDKDGNSNKMVRIKVNADVNANDPSYQGAYDGEVVTTKQRVAPQESYMKKGEFNGLPIGAEVEKAGVIYTVTDKGLIPK